MGTMLHLAKLTDGAPERWNAERPEVVSSIHRAYVEAGSDFISTTFGGTRNRPRSTASRTASRSQRGRRAACAQLPAIGSSRARSARRAS
jgi:methionine synthase I (cobalamin-dependent)